MRDFNGTNEDLRNADGISNIDVDTMTIFSVFQLDSIASNQTMWSTASAVTAGQSAMSISYQSAANVLRATYRFSTTPGEWRVTGQTPAVDTLYRCAVKYDRSSVANNPTVYINGSKFTVGSGLTEQAAPVGTAHSGLDTMILGANVGLLQDMNGQECEIAFWSTLFSDAKMEALTNGFSPAWFPNSREWYCPLIDNLRDVDQGANLTATGTTVVDHPRVIYPGPVVSVPKALLRIPVASYHYRHHLRTG